MASTVYRTTSQVMLPTNRIITDVSAFYSITNADIIAVGDDVKSGELYNLLSTLVGDEPFLPTYGCDLPKRVFEPITAKLQIEVTTDVYASSKTWLPDITVVPNGFAFVAMAGQRMAGVVVSYQHAGSLWNLPVYLTSQYSDF